MSERNPDTWPKFSDPIVEHGDYDCTDCGEPHNRRDFRVNGQPRTSWADPADGHPYHSSADVTIARLKRELAECRARG